ncbi:MAG: hypothetical protein QW728_01820 [Thermoplasmata archaeon]
MNHKAEKNSENNSEDSWKEGDGINSDRKKDEDKKRETDTVKSVTTDKTDNGDKAVSSQSQDKGSSCSEGCSTGNTPLGNTLQYPATRKGMVILTASFLGSFLLSLFSVIMGIYSLVKFGFFISESSSFSELVDKVVEHLKSSLTGWCASQVFYFSVLLIILCLIFYGFILLFKGRNEIGDRHGHSIRIKIATLLLIFWFVSKVSAFLLFILSLFTSILTIIGLPISFFISMLGAFSLVFVKYLAASGLVSIYGRVFLIAGFVSDILSSISSGILSCIIWLALFDISLFVLSVILLLTYMICSAVSDLFFGLGYLNAYLRIRKGLT